MPKEISKQNRAEVSDVLQGQALAPNQEEIQTRAHFIFLERGGEQGRDVEDWFQAEQEIKGEAGKPIAKGQSA